VLPRAHRLPRVVSGTCRATWVPGALESVRGCVVLTVLRRVTRGRAFGTGSPAMMTLMGAVSAWDGMLLRALARLGINDIV
jgi:hypothetical protein